LFLLPQYLCAQSGALDATFDPGIGVDLSVYSIAIQTNGQILIAGDFTSFNSASRTNVARLNAGGSRDETFNPGAALRGSFPYVNAVALQSSGNVLVGGSFTNTAATNFARLNTNGSLDTTFTTVADDTVNAVAIQTNGSILIGGFFTHVNGRARAGIARLDSGGTLDLSFNPSVSGAFSAVYSLALQGDGKILIGGSFTNVNASTRTNIARLNTDGTLDATFKPASVGGGQLSPAAFYTLGIDYQGRVIAGGDFTSVNGQVRTNLARFNSDGSLDMSFDPAAGTDYAVNSLVLETYGKILIAGYFDMVNGATNNYLARLNNDGSLDSTFNIGTGASDVVYAVALQPDGKVLIGGAFTSVNGTNRSGIARLQNALTVPSPLLANPILSNSTFRVSVATFSGKSYVLQFKNALTDTNWTALPSVPGDGTVKAMTDNSATVARRFYRVEVQ
jgi:uncharacterized delta-60 repeat protein